MKIKVMHLIPHLKMGGAETLVKDYALNINKGKFEFLVVTVAGKSGSFNEKILEESNIKVIHLGDEVSFDKEANIFTKILKRIKRYRLFKKYVLREKPDIIHSHLPTNDFLNFLDTKRLNIKLFHTLHNEINVLFNNRKIYKLTTNHCIKKRDMTLIALHERMKSEANDLFDTNRSIILNNTIDISKFRDIETGKTAVRKGLGIKENAFVIGHVGRFATQKNHTFLIDIFSKVKLNNPEALLVLIGTGELEEEIKSKVNKLNLNGSVLFLGNRGDIPELMNIMDVFLFPSLYEGFGNVLLEAQAAKVKCVVSNAIPKEVFLTNYITSLSLNDSTDKWCNEILNEDKLEKKDLALKEFDIKTVIKKLESVYISS